MTNENIFEKMKMPLFLTGNTDILSSFTPKIFQTYKKLASERNMHSYEISARPVSFLGENSNGIVLQVCLKPSPDVNEETEGVEKSKPFVSILKISPKTPAFRNHAHIVELYNREVFMYQKVFKEFSVLKQERLEELQNSNHDDCNKSSSTFDIVPEILYANLDVEDEFIICEDLTLSDYKQNLRTNMPTYDLVCASFRSIAEMHAMSFILQYRKPERFKILVSKITDILFTSDMELISEQFGKRYIRRTREMLEREAKPSLAQIEALKKLEYNFKEICLKCVNGKDVAPYAVICHGDFWNNNIVYNYDNQGKAISAKLIDFQLSRYATPILDLVHYLYTCTESDVRSKHFMEFMNIYHETLTQKIQYFGHNIDEIYPKDIFLQHLRDFGIFGFCMASFAMPFFISTASELPDLEEASCAIGEISSNENSDEEVQINKVGCGVNDNATIRCLELLDEYDLLCERTLPIFKRRMFGIVKDLEKYQMIEKVLKW